MVGSGSGIWFSAVFVADYVMSHFVLKLVKTSVELSEADDTEAISKEVRMLLSNRSVFYRRFAEAYPEVIFKTERIAKRMEEIRVETERLRQEAEERVAQMRLEVAENLEPTRSVKNEIIEKQDALIGLLYREEDASPPGNPGIEARSRIKKGCSAKAACAVSQAVTRANS